MAGYSDATGLGVVFIRGRKVCEYPGMGFATLVQWRAAAVWWWLMLLLMKRSSIVARSQRHNQASSERDDWAQTSLQASCGGWAASARPMTLGSLTRQL